jgi:phosphoserine phosphatase
MGQSILEHSALVSIVNNPQDSPVIQLSSARDASDATTTALGAPAGGMLLAVDLDGTVLNTDTLFEALAELLRRRPFWTLWQMIQLPFAIAKVKARIQSEGRIDIAILPVNEQVLAYCQQSKAEGRPVWLVSAADQGIVDKVAGHFGVFDRAVGSDGATNNKGSAKGAFLQKVAPEGFEYVGDSRADLKVWLKAKSASLVGGGDGRARAVEKMGVRIAHRFDRPKRGIGAWTKALRPHQWIKNGLIFVPAIIAMQISDPSTFLTLLIALPLLCALASGTYILNDLLDLHADRTHPSRRHGPFASGRLKIWQGFVVAPALIIGGLVGGVLLSPPFAVTMVSYLATKLAYSLTLKRISLAATLTLSLLYALRIAMGAVLAGVALSHWLVVASMLVVFSLSLATQQAGAVWRKTPR